ncbi:MAG: hypothetical protein ABTD50_01630 [Polyangiaceae bacterium]|jgi:hypothetical protein
MTDGQEDTDARLERLRRATDRIRPRADFVERVVARVERDAGATDWVGDLSRAARMLVPVAAVAAALGIVWAAHSERAWTDSLTAANTAELDMQW